MARYFRNINNALTVTGRGGAMTRQSLFGFGGFGTTDPVLDAAPAEADGQVAAEEIVDAAADAAAIEASEPPVSTISFYPDGTSYTTGVIGNSRAAEWADAMQKVLGYSGGIATTNELLAMAKAQVSSVKTWKWVALLGIPVVGLATWQLTKRYGR